MKNEMRTTSDGGKGSPVQIKSLIESVFTYYTTMLLNPFYESGISLNSTETQANALDTDQLSEESSNSDCSSCSSRSSRDS